MYQKKDPTKTIKLLGMVGALVAAAGLALNSQYVEAVGLVAAAFSSTTAFSTQ